MRFSKQRPGHLPHDKGGGNGGVERLAVRAHGDYKLSVAEGKQLRAEPPALAADGNGGVKSAAAGEGVSVLVMSVEDGKAVVCL